MTDTIPIYPWFDQAPDHLKTKNQLAEAIRLWGTVGPPWRYCNHWPVKGANHEHTEGRWQSAPGG